MVTVILFVLSAPSFISTRHKERATVLFESPGTADFLAIELSVVHYEMFAKILLLKVSKTTGFNPTLQHEFSDIVMTLTSDDLTGFGLERQPGHIVLLTILFVISLPNGVGLELIRLRNGIALRRKASWLRHSIAGDWNICNCCHHHRLRLHHHLLLLHHHWLLLHLILRLRLVSGLRRRR
jgi:hypothetical protein